MRNRFRVDGIRFDVKKTGRLHITGYFNGKKDGDFRLGVFLDGKELKYDDETVKFSECSRNNIDECEKTQSDFSISVDLPEGWERFQRLRVVFDDEGKKRTAGTFSVKKLTRISNIRPYFVDRFINEKEGFEVCGWYIDTGNVSVAVTDSKKSEIAATLERTLRPDVTWTYTECDREDVVGFKISGNEKLPPRSSLRISYPDMSESVETILTGSAPRRIAKKLISNLKALLRYCGRYGAVNTARRVFNRFFGVKEPYQRWRKLHFPSKKELKKQKETRFDYSPLISIVVPLYKTPVKYLDALIKSVKNQTYANWQLCLSDGSGKDSSLTKRLNKYEREDGRIRAVYNGTSLQISDNTNAALHIASGDYIAFADHDDLLTPNALYECVAAINEDPEIEMIYSDEDKVDMNGKNYFGPHFKSDFNLDLLRGNNYICHLVVVRRSLYESAGDLRSAYDGAQDFDFVLRCAEIAKDIKHIPKVLYHWRCHPGSTAMNPASKDYAYEAGLRVIRDHYQRVGIKAEVSQTKYKGFYRSKYALSGRPPVSVIIANKDHADDLKKCIDSIRLKTDYGSYEIIVVENASEDRKTFDYYRELEETDPRVRIIRYEADNAAGKGFNYSAINNFGASHAKGDYLLFLNNDTEIIGGDWMTELLGYCMRDDVGAVGAKLYYEDDTVQHAGVVLGIGGIASNVFISIPKDHPGYFARAVIASDYSAVSGACMMVKRRVFEEVEGFDENLAVAYNDVDLCMKIRKAGYLIVYNPYAELYHYESKSRGLEVTPEKAKRLDFESGHFRSKWSEELEKGDPYYNPNLTLKKCDFSLDVD